MGRSIRHRRPRNVRRGIKTPKRANVGLQVKQQWGEERKYSFTGQSQHRNQITSTDGLKLDKRVNADGTVTMRWVDNDQPNVNSNRKLYPVQKVGNSRRRR